MTLKAEVLQVPDSPPLPSPLVGGGSCLALLRCRWPAVGLGGSGGWGTPQVNRNAARCRLHGLSFVPAGSLPESSL